MCLQGSSCILSSTTKLSWQIEHTASLPSFAKTSVETDVTGRLATTSLLAGGTLGAPESREIIF